MVIKRKLTNRAKRDEEMLESGYMSIPDAAKELTLSDPRVYSLAREEKLKSVKVGGSVYVTIVSMREYQRSLQVPKGMISMRDAMDSLHYARSTILRRLKEGVWQGVKINGLLYFNQAELMKERPAPVREKVR